MKRKTIIRIVLVVIILLAVGYHYLQLSVYPLGGGRELVSPNGKFTAHASDLMDESFWGKREDFYEFRINRANGSLVREVTMDSPPEGTIGWRNRGEIDWESDSSAVTFSFQDLELTIESASDPTDKVSRTSRR
ncbi:MAG: hypothetical protein ACR2RV_04130 [Verrucomicrobiales bacterium]